MRVRFLSDNRIAHFGTAIIVASLLAACSSTDVGPAVTSPTTPLVKSPVEQTKPAAPPVAAATEPRSANTNANPVLTSRVTDNANLLTPNQRRVIRAQLTQFESETTHQIAVLTIESLAGEGIEDYSLRVAQAARLGTEASNNGILMTIAVAEKKIRIELGQGFERHVQAADATKILETKVLPHLSKGRNFEGIRNGIDSLMSVARRYQVQ